MGCSFTHAMCKMPFGDSVATAPSEQLFKIASAEFTSNCLFNGTTQTKNGGNLVPPKARFLVIASSRLFLRICKAW